MRHPVVVFCVTLVALWLCERFGAYLRRRRTLADDTRQDFDVVLTAALTLLGLMIGFTFSMAVTRFDQRKNFEENEANAIGTEYLRADLLPPAEADRVHQLLRTYLDQRIAFYQAHGSDTIRHNAIDTAKTEDALWAAVKAPASANPTPVAALAVAGMNDVLNSQGYTQFAWGNRIPLAAWLLLISIGIGCNLMIGYSSRRPLDEKRLAFILPMFVAMSFLLISDIDAPRGGLIRIEPTNLILLSQSLGH